MATRRESPALASQAENASSSMGAAEKFVESICRIQSDSEMNSESIIPSRQRRADKRCIR